MKKSLLALSLAVSLFADTKNDYEVSGVIGNVQHLGDQHPLSDELVYGIRGAARASDWLLGELAYDRADVEYTKINGAETYLNRFGLNALIEDPTSNTYVPYLVLGGGYEVVQDEQPSEESGLFANYGVGMRFVLSRDFHMKLEAKHAIKENGHNSLYSTVAFVLPFGYAAEKGIVHATPQEKKVAPVVAPAKNFTYDNLGREVKYTFNVQFDFDKYDIKPEFDGDIRDFVAFMNRHPKIRAEIDGYADNIGAKDYNIDLSVKRAEAILNQIVKEGIDKSRLSVRGYGEAGPTGDNETIAGRYTNRRVEATLFNNMEK